MYNGVKVFDHIIHVVKVFDHFCGFIQKGWRVHRVQHVSVASTEDTSSERYSETSENMTIVK